MFAIELIKTTLCTSNYINILFIITISMIIILLSSRTMLPGELFWWMKKLYQRCDVHAISHVTLPQPDSKGDKNSILSEQRKWINKQRKHYTKDTV